MSSIKVKFRKSLVKGRPGTIYYQICHASRTRQITSKIHIYPEDWDPENKNIMASGGSGNEYRLQKYRLKIESDKKQLQHIIKNFEDKGLSYSISDVRETFESSYPEIRILHYMSMQIEQLKRSRHHGTARNYQCAMNSFSDFLGGEDMSFSMLNEGLVMEYNSYLEKRGITKNSISFYMRIWRAVYNRAAKEKIVAPDHPFKNVYTGIDKTRKRALDEECMIQLMELDLKDQPQLELSRDLFIFSYCTRGMAFVDIVFLRKSDIQGDTIVYHRRKTQGLMIIKIEPCIHYLIKKYENITIASDYVFPILNTTEDEMKYKQYASALSLHNQHLKKLSLISGIRTPLSSYIPRHTWATTARNHQIPISIISAGMGHTSIKTTEIYLASLENSVIDDANSGILEKMNRLFSF